jgi:hypothetical protein
MKGKVAEIFSRWCADETTKGVMTPYGMKRRRKRKRREFETAGGTKKRSPAKDEQPLPPPSHERGDAALFKDLR